MESSDFDEVNIVIVGDASTGKSSLASGLISNSFKGQLITVIPPVGLPSSFFPNYKVSVQVIDTSSSDDPRDKTNREESMRKAHVICIVHDITNVQSFTNILARWIPDIQALEISKQLPIIIMGNKMDEAGPTHEQQLQIKQLLQQCKNAFYHICCSAKNNTNVKGGFEKAVSVVLCPPGILIAQENDSIDLSSDYKRELKRIYLLLTNGGDVLNDQTLLKYQKSIHENSNEEGVAKLKEVLVKRHPSGLQADGVNFEGFLALHRFLLEKRLFESLWRPLRSYGYNLSLKLDPSYMSTEKSRATDNAEILYGRELSPVGTQFIFDKYNNFAQPCGTSPNASLGLTAESEQRLYATAPENPFKKGGAIIACERKRSCSEAISRAGFLALWRLQTHLDYHVTMHYLRYLGYTGNLDDAFTLFPNPCCQNSLAKRNMFFAFVVGTSDSGAEILLDGLMGQPTFAAPDRAINTVSVKGDDKYLGVRLHSLHVLLYPGNLSNNENNNNNRWKEWT